MSSPSIHTFNPFSLQHGSNHDMHAKVQEVIYYGESRCRQALTDMSKAGARHQAWMQRSLQQELVCIFFFSDFLLLILSQLFLMSYVGIATSVGQLVEVPITLRSLAGSLAVVSEAELPISYDLGLIAMLDCGTRSEQYGRVVNSYLHAWWKRKSLPSPGAILSTTTLEDCLKHHRVQLLRSTAGDPIPEMPITTIPPLQLTSMGDADADPGADADLKCNHCDVYRLLATDLLEELRSIKNFTSGLVASTLHDIDVTSRRAAGFYILHEKVILKEMQSQSVPQAIDGIGHGTRAVKLGRRVREEALVRLKDMPAASHKWTWGETLTREDILSLKHVSNAPIHSGYDISLNLGQMRGVYTSTNSLPTGTAKYSALPASQQSSPPLTHLHFPKQFELDTPSAAAGPISSDVADSGAKSANCPFNLAATNDDGDSGLPNSTQPSNLTAITQLWMEVGSGANAAETTPSHTHQPSPPSSLAGITEIWMEMESGSEPVNVDGDVALTSQIWLEMEDSADRVNADADADGVMLASQIWLEGADQVNANANADVVALTSQIWLEVEGDADPANVDANADRVALASEIWLDMDNADPANSEDKDEGDNKKADQQEKEGDSDEDKDDQGDNDNSADGNNSDSSQAARRASHLINLTVSPSKITLPRREYTSMDFDVPLVWFVEKDLPVMMDDMGISD